MPEGNESIISHETIVALEAQLKQLRVEDWLHHDILHWQWYMLLAVLIIPWFIWWRLADRKRLIEILLLGMIVLIISSYLDAVLSDLGLWVYHFWIVPYWPRLISADFTVLPVLYMLVYQRCTNWKSFTVTMIILAALLASAGEFFLVWTDIYDLYAWKHYYSFPIYFAVGIFARWLTQTLLTSQARARDQWKGLKQ